MTFSFIKSGSIYDLNIKEIVMFHETDFNQKLFEGEILLNMACHTTLIFF